VNEHTLAQQVVLAAVADGVRIGTAESLTAGMVASALATVPGASAALQGGIVSYQGEVKTGVLGVDRDLLAAEGAVHADVARQMAEGARRVLGADIAVSTTGVAGPEPHGGKPVGTVFIGTADADGSDAVAFTFSGGRAEIRAQAEEAALEKLLEAIQRTTAARGQR
jgi:nicotinamide-nucleotide amidase